MPRLVSFRGLISDEHPRLFYREVPPRGRHTRCKIKEDLPKPCQNKEIGELVLKLENIFHVSIEL